MSSTAPYKPTMIDFATESLGGMGIDPGWFDCEEWLVDGDVITAEIIEYGNGGAIADRFTVTITRSPR